MKDAIGAVIAFGEGTVVLKWVTKTSELSVNEGLLNLPSMIKSTSKKCENTKLVDFAERMITVTARGLLPLSSDDSSGFVFTMSAMVRLRPTSVGSVFKAHQEFDEDANPHNKMH